MKLIRCWTFTKLGAEPWRSIGNGNIESFVDCFNPRNGFVRTFLEGRLMNVYC